jgi:hypothetical protein
MDTYSHNIQHTKTLRQLGDEDLLLHNQVLQDACNKGLPNRKLSGFISICIFSSFQVTSYSLIYATSNVDDSKHMKSVISSKPINQVDIYNNVHDRSFYERGDYHSLFDIPQLS